MSTKSTFALAAALLLSGGVAAFAANTVSHGSKNGVTYPSNGAGAYSSEFTPRYESALDAYAMEHSVGPFNYADRLQFERQPGISSER
jgi:hypothetical protein